MTAAIRSISELLTDMKATLNTERITIATLLEKFHERGFGFFLFIFILPLALPVPKPPGISTIFALPIIFLTLQQAIGKHTIWLPEKLKRRDMPRETIMKMIDTVLPWTQKIEALIKPRMGFMTQSAFSNIIGILGFLMACFIAIPLPLTNTVPAWGIALMALGVIMRDGLAVLAGAFIGTFWMIFLTGTVLILGNEGIAFLKETFKSFLL